MGGTVGFVAGAVVGATVGLEEGSVALVPGTVASLLPEGAVASVPTEGETEGVLLPVAAVVGAVVGVVVGTVGSGSVLPQATIPNTIMMTSSEAIIFFIVFRPFCSNYPNNFGNTSS